MLTKLSRWLYPPRCLLCGAAAPSGVCPDCASEFVENRSACVRCALPLESDEQQLCGRCLKKLPYFDSAWSPYIYAQPLEWMICELKFSAKLAQASALSGLLLPRLPDLPGKPDCLMPVPLHPQRLRQRGFNQSLELVRPLAQALGVTLDVNSCVRSRATEPQTGMTARQRQRNLRNAFSFSNDKKYHHVVLFDDVMTTGATLNELARVLKKQGVTRVDVWSLARAGRHNKKQD